MSVLLLSKFVGKRRIIEPSVSVRLCSRKSESLNKVLICI